ncbi:uncharacterized protein LOC133854561 [Alnus glutinosa]|uniref:uncharacterized protein LOC133854561 n=1 Tax=Alnus glutinosa TaxID=3517 RepID=UPI002D78F0F1|nr:uncharacterized protein LOC133854561 [Alnus glutinosa]
MEDYDHNTERHHLIYKEEMKKDGEKIALCWYCRKPISGSLHNCVECRNLPVHSKSSSFEDHLLDFKEKLENDGDKEVVCWGCNELVLGPAYKCRRPISECSFVVHKSCTDLSYQINHPLHPNHTLTLQKPGRNCCDACRRSHDRYFFYRCDLCLFQLDIECATRLPINPNDCHQHDFFSILKPIQYSCDACGKEFKNMAYKLCNICKLLVHNRCAELPRFAKFTLHNHILNLIYSLKEFKKHDGIFCKICCNKVNTEYAAYYCLKSTHCHETKSANRRYMIKEAEEGRGPLASSKVVQLKKSAASIKV